MKPDGNLGDWLDASQAAIRASVAGITPEDADVARFEHSLKENEDAERLLRDVLPKCDREALAVFTMVVVDQHTESRLQQMTRRRGAAFAAAIRGGARGNPDVQTDATELLAKADRAFNTKRRGLADYCFGALIIRRYFAYRSGIEVTARELAAILRAALAASGRPPFQQIIDYDLLRRNLKAFEAKHPYASATPEVCGSIIERR